MSASGPGLVASRGRLIDLLLDCYDYIDNMVEFGGDDGEGDRLRAIGDELRGLGVQHSWSEHEDSDESEDEDEGEEEGTGDGDE